MHKPFEKKPFKPLGVALLTVSDTRDESTDRSGRVLAVGVKESGHELIERLILPDDVYLIRRELSRWIADEGIQAIVTSGGTGLTFRDSTPEAAMPLFDRTIDGFGELFRWLSHQEIGTSAIASRAVAGIANATFIFCLPGSVNACETGWYKIIRPQLDSRSLPCNFSELLPRLRTSRDSDRTQ
ncbi:MAG: molybdenum cofactor biosynthesis protein B [Gammaproteobacteria bacterium]|nr:molybdenum cofactor biosynthesis protein B [Gammaproteobacteria bacterium]